MCLFSDVSNGCKVLLKFKDIWFDVELDPYLPNSMKTHIYYLTVEKDIFFSNGKIFTLMLANLPLFNKIMLWECIITWLPGTYVKSYIKLFQIIHQYHAALKRFTMPPQLSIIWGSSKVTVCNATNNNALF